MKKIILSRTGCGYLFMSRKPEYSRVVDTGLPGGEYCNIIDGCKSKVLVYDNSTANIEITSDIEHQIIAICVGCTGEDPTPAPTTTTTATTSTTTATTATTNTITTTTTITDTTTTEMETTTSDVCCEAVDFASSGKIQELFSNTSGTYRKISEAGTYDTNVYKHDEQEYYLFYYSNSLMHFSAWVLTSDSTGNQFSIASEEDTHCVTGEHKHKYIITMLTSLLSGTGNWQVFQGDWIQDDTVTTECNEETTVVHQTTTSIPECCNLALFYSSGS